MPRSPTAIPELDGLRAIAVLLVVVRHGVNPFWSESDGLFPVFGWDLGIPMTNGWIGVDLFFVLSGFLITHQVLKRYGKGFGRPDVGDYVYRRAMRIVPAYFVAIAIALSGLIPYWSVSGDRLGARVGYHLLFLQDYLPSNILSVFWSLGVEEKFYALAPFLLMGILRLDSMRGRYIALGAVALLPTVFRVITTLTTSGIDDYADFFPVYRSPFHMTFDGLAVGVLAAFIYRDRDQLAWTSRPRTVNGLFWAGAIPYLWLAAGQPLMDSISLFDKLVLQAALGWTAGAMLLSLALGGGPSGVFRHGWMFVVSKLSYSWYLMHIMFVPLALRITDGLFGADTASPGVRFVLFAPTYLALSLTAAFALHFAAEKPFLILRDRTRSDHELTPVARSA